MPVGADHELDDDGELVARFQQRRGAGRELLRQHREIPARPCTPSSSASRRVLVDRRILRHERVDVGDGDQHPRRAVGQPLGDLELIEIARRVVVDGRPEQTAQVADIGPDAVAERVAGNFSELSGDLGVEHQVEPAQPHQLLGRGS